MSQKVVIIGAGAAGVFTAYDLWKNAPGQYDITLLESKDYVGGNTQSVDVPGTDHKVDVGAQFFSPVAQPLYALLLDELGILQDPDIIITPPSGITVYNSMNGPVRFHVPRTIGEFFWQILTSISDERKREDYFDFILFNVSALYYNFAPEVDHTQTVESWLQESPQTLLGPEFVRDVVKPLLYQFIVVDPKEIDKSSAYFTLTYYAWSVVGSILRITPGVLKDIVDFIKEFWTDPTKAFEDLEHVLSTPLFKVYNSLIGLDGILQKVLNETDVSATLNATVTEVTQSGGQWSVQTASHSYPADHVVFACHPYAAAGILQSGGNDMRELIATLNQFPYVHLPISMQQTSTCYLPAESQPNPWEAVNIVSLDDKGQQHYLFTVRFEALQSEVHAFKSWGNPGLVPPECASQFLGAHHNGVVPTKEFILAQKALEPFQGENSLWFAGGYTNWYDSQESAYRSALAVSAGVMSTSFEETMSKLRQQQAGQLSELVAALEQIGKEVVPSLGLEVPSEKTEAIKTLTSRLAAVAARS